MGLVTSTAHTLFRNLSSRWSRNSSTRGRIGSEERSHLPYPLVSRGWEGLVSTLSQHHKKQSTGAGETDQW